jgi:hypothetical protein
MLLKLLSRILVPERRQPELVSWAPEMPDPITGASIQIEELTLKRVLHAGIVVSVACPSFENTETAVHIEVLNNSRKDLGFGAQGVALALSYTNKRVGMSCRTLTTRGSKDSILVESGQEIWMLAKFDSVPTPVHAEIVIQANRVLAAPYVFRIPFDMGGIAPEKHIGTFEELLSLDPRQVKSISVRPK